MSKRRIGMKLALAICATLLVSVLTAPLAMAKFGINNFDVAFTNQDGTPATQAGSHPFAMTTSFKVNNTEVAPFNWIPDDEFKNSFFGQVAGFVGDATAMPYCSTADFSTVRNFPSGFYTLTSCPTETAVGLVANYLQYPFIWNQVPVYNLKPPPGVAVRLGFKPLAQAITIDIGIKQGGQYNVEAGVINTTQIVTYFGSVLQLWGDPSDPRHDAVRGYCGDALEGEGDAAYANGEPMFSPGFGSEFGAITCPTETPMKPFLTLPRSCTGPAMSTWRADSWSNPGVWVEGSAITHDNSVPPNPQGFTGCGKLPFSPEVSAQPTSATAESGMGLDFDLDFNQEGLTSNKGLAQSEAKKVEVTLPDGVTVNPSVAEGLGVCTPAQLDAEKIDTPTGEGCPNSSKIGTVHVDTPLLDQPVEGDVFLAQQDDPGTAEPGAENPFDSLIAFYMVLRNAEKGLFVKIPAKVEPDPTTGQLVTTVDDIPQLPFSHFNLHFKEGERAPLVSPPACGTFTTKAELFPWSAPANPRTALSSFQITKGANGGSCPPGGIPPFKPEFGAGSLNNNAGSYSPFNMRLIRHDGEQDMTKFGSILPPGGVGNLSGVSKCSDAAIAVARGKTGREELASSSCPASSQIGRTLAGAGVGSALTYVPGKIYLGGPYKGDPLSVISVTPAVAGPFDAGDVVVQIALTLDPKTAEVVVDGASSDPIPHILKGIPLKIRDLRVYVDRSNFILNPTSCDESSARATLFGSFLNVLDPADDKPVDLSARYQAANCLNLGFKPKLNLNLKGGTKRGGHPGLKALYTPRKGDANVEGLVVRLPRSAFLDQGHIRTICTRVQFAADNCPKAAQYGYIKAWTPLLDEPLEGPVWLRSSNHKLPDLVFDLHGLVDVEVATRIDSARGGIRATVEDAPDAPLSKVELRMQGGKKGLIINSRNLCNGPSRANVQFSGQNGKQSTASPVMRADGCGGKRKR